MPESDTPVRAQSPSEPTSLRSALAHWPRSARSSGGMGAAAVVLTLAQPVGLWGFVVFAFGGVTGLIVLAIVFATACALVSLSLIVFTGRAHVLASCFAATAAAVMLSVAIGRVGTTTLMWVPPGFDLAYPLIGVAAALTLGLFLGPLWLRIVGGVTVVAAVALAVWLVHADHEADVAQSDSVGQAQRQENFEYFLEAGVHPLVADLPGSEVARVIADGGPAQAWTVTEAGAVVEIDVDTVQVDAMSDAYPCWWLAEPNMDLASTDALADYADWCVKDAEGWARPDGTGYARIRDGRLIAVVSPTDHNVEIVGGRRPADAAEVAATLAALRPMTRSELRAAVEEAWLSGNF